MSRVRLSAAVLVLFAGSLAVAKDGPRQYTYRPVSIAFVPGFSTNGPESRNVSSSFSLNVIGGYLGRVRGFEMGGVFNIDENEVLGYQSAGVFNIVDGSFGGVQQAGVFSIVGGSFGGVQQAGVMEECGKNAGHFIFLSDAEARRGRWTTFGRSAIGKVYLKAKENNHG
jgi:hypothetical protein